MTSGRLILAATPLGDVRDASPRLVSALADADVIAAEDTRRLRSLASALEVTPRGRVVSFYEDVETARLPKLLEALHAGETVVLVTDAGMPSVSDPGFRLVAACVAEDLPVTCLPGPSAVTTALALSGLPCDRFCFEGFAPRKPGERTKWLTALRAEPRTAVFFESPHRLASLLSDAAAVLGPDRPAAVCRELTKTYEEVKRGTLAELASWAEEGVRGEITVVLSGAEPRAVSVADLVDEVAARVAAGERLKSAAAEVAEATGVSKKELYDAVLAARVK
ncbi:tetrapyrrole methylase family protein [Amycolatopsis mediterranei S699]|uniref:Ribosomal RNA small subunit methyltransferase I n=2 Tax=Amycolatopsis mediterranei TaxID=33910 RepID=A0A0H3DID6_AMYMU|nr:16S rRNA (cytidine(1402)-2'-O)-methyltransferase [Amycolatopsis mediterranei]ADJ49957.1 tetrapyrrole methylase family protein [Amycolatopsis mediterranei U32]AEK46950.1 tetrapyrrole methylase family protein [Amycolatopsis mediterranei S699]AFO81664.1 tetrapyrrole methylase family protein [Amycolatopsis mediterranei S699]AGT88793.1 tetrapyrrole methylase family protein [Amycolatopsis mediterranei RB]KDO07795.1 16S rRNA methyltransferase [Amycolatopsis mediterranei]